MKKLSRNNQGFTIIEVLIVLVIAAVIMLIVFLAVPALQRNSRNNARRNDAGRVGSAVTEFVTNNNGTQPTSADKTAVLNIAGTLGYYQNAANITIATTGATVNEENMRIVTGHRCSGTGGGVTSSGRSVAIQIAVETAGTPTPVCIDV